MKKLRDVLFWSGIFLVILTYIVIKPLENLDEMWNFNVARCIANGLIPYKEISMVSTPLLGFLTAIFLKIFGTEMFITGIEPGKALVRFIVRPVTVELEEEIPDECWKDRTLQEYYIEYV